MPEGLVKISSGLYEVNATPSPACLFALSLTNSLPSVFTDHFANGEAAGRVADQSSGDPQTPISSRWPLSSHTQPVASAEVRDLSHTSVSIAPADYASWHDVRTELMAEVSDRLQPSPVPALALSTLPKFFTGQNGLQGPRGVRAGRGRRLQPGRAPRSFPAGGAGDRAPGALPSNLRLATP